MIKHWKIILPGILGVHLLFLVFLKFTAWPETLLWPYLMTKGWFPYADVAIAHTPLMILKLALFFKLFGVGILQLKIFTWILIIFTNLVLFWVAKKLWNLKTAIFSLMSFVVLQLFYDGNGLWFDLFMTLPVLVSFCLAKQKKWIWAGVLWALAFISKQTAVWFLIPLAAEILTERKTIRKNTIGFALGTVPVFLIFILGLRFFEIFDDFYKWAINFGIFVLPKAQGQIHLPDLRNLAIAGFPFLVFIPLLLKKKSNVLNLLLWAIAGSMGAIPRFEYFHFQPAVPFLAIAAGQALSVFKKEKGFWKKYLAFYLAGMGILVAGFLLNNWREGTRFYEKDVEEVASYVKQNSDPDDYIFVLNWWDSIYALSDRTPSVNPWVPQLSWYMETPGIQERMVSDLVIKPPRIVIYYPYTISGLSGYVPRKVYDYISVNYELKEMIGGVEILVHKIIK